MPPLSQRFIRTSLIYLVASLALGLLLALQPLGDLPAVVTALAPVYFHLFMVGWVMQLIVGVAYWMFPKATRERPRGSDALAWATYGLLNAGLLLRAIAEPALVATGRRAWGVSLAVSAALQWLGAVAFVWNSWARVKER